MIIFMHPCTSHPIPRNSCLFGQIPRSYTIQHTLHDHLYLFLHHFLCPGLGFRVSVAPVSLVLAYGNLLGQRGPTTSHPKFVRIGVMVIVVMCGVCGGALRMRWGSSSG